MSLEKNITALIDKWASRKTDLENQQRERITRSPTYWAIDGQAKMLDVCVHELSKLLTKKIDYKASYEKLLEKLSDDVCACPGDPDCSGDCIQHWREVSEVESDDEDLAIEA